MIDHLAKSIWIVDFKTGEYEKEQLATYKEAVEQLAYIQKERYDVKTEIVFIRLPEL